MRTREIPTKFPILPLAKLSSDSQMSLTLTPPPAPSFASPPPRRPVAGAAGAYPSAAARTPSSRLRVSCRATCRAPPSPSFAELERLPRRGEEGPSLYEILRVRENASAREIKAAYRALAKAHHPDAAGRDGRDFIEIHGAYETLSDPAARAVYDLSLGGGGAGIGRRRPRPPEPARGVGGFCPTRRWETDQCW